MKGLVSVPAPIPLTHQRQGEEHRAPRHRMKPPTGWIQFPQLPYHWWPKTRPCSTQLHIFDAHPYPKAFLSGTHAPLPSTFTSNSRLTPFKRGQKEQKWSSLFHYLKCLKSFIYLLLKIQEAPFYLQASLTNYTFLGPTFLSKVLWAPTSELKEYFREIFLIFFYILLGNQTRLHIYQRCADLEERDEHTSGIVNNRSFNRQKLASAATNTAQFQGKIPHVLMPIVLFCMQSK